MTGDKIILEQVEGAVTVSTEGPTARLRWHNGVLQQYWVKESRVGGIATRYDYEWRDVPTDNANG